MSNQQLPSEMVEDEPQPAGRVYPKGLQGSEIEMTFNSSTSFGTVLQIHNE
jgi:hypothetical protein